MKDRGRWLVVVAYAAAMAWVESAVVYYLRTLIDRMEPYQVNPLPRIGGLGQAEMVREMATMIMLLTVGILAGRNWRSRLGYSAIAFGVWDILYYVFLRVICGWPHSLLDWDILFLVPLPWWGPVLAPVSIAILMIWWGTLASSGPAPASRPASAFRVWSLNFLGVALALYLFMADTLKVADQGVEALRNVLPARFNWPLFSIALALMAAPIARLLWPTDEQRRTTQGGPGFSQLEEAPMTASAASAANENRLGDLLRGEPGFLSAWIEQWEARRTVTCVVTIVVGAGLYGAAMGYWRDPRQALFVAIKFPLIILLTTLGNALLNAMLAPLLGLNISLRQSFLAVLMSFTIASAILGSFSPLTAFMVWNAPPFAAVGRASDNAYSAIQLAHVAIIAFAGLAANLRLVQLLRQLSGNARIARRVLFAWLAGNLFFGSQLSWILRPFIGSPGLPVEFLRATAFQGNFYETVFHSVVSILNNFLD